MIDSPSPGSDPVLPGPAPVESLGCPSDGPKVEKLLSCPIISLQGLFALHVRAAGQGQAFLVAPAAWGADAGRAAQAAYGEIARVLQDQGLTIVQERLFGSLTVKSAVMTSRAAALRAGNISPAGPVTYIQGHPPWGEGFAGTIIRTVSCLDPTR